MDHHKKSKKSRKWTSMILRVAENIKLEKRRLVFSSGMVEGTGITVNAAGDTLTFNQDGSYLFELSGEAVASTFETVKVVYETDKFPKDIATFAEVTPYRKGNTLTLRGIPTILPLKEGQKIQVKFVGGDPVTVLADTRLLIYRVA